MGMDPITMMAVGTGLSAVSSISGGMAAGKAGRINQRIAEGEARSIEQQGAAEASRVRRDFAKFRGTQTADLNAYGASASEGTGLLMAREAAKLAKLDELNILTDSQNRASASRMGGQMSRAEGAAKRTQGMMGGFATALSGFGQWQALQQ